MTDKKRGITYPTTEEVETAGTRLEGLEEAKTALENVGIDVPETLLAQMEEISAQTREKLPKWVTDPKWIEKLETLKDGLERQIQTLEGIKGVNKKAIELLRDQLEKVNNVLDEPKEYLHGKSKREYTETIGEISYEKVKRELNPEQAYQVDQLLDTLKTRFEASDNDKLRRAIDFADVEKSLRADTEALFSLHKLEETGGEPRIVGIEGDEFIFEDRSMESPSGRRNLNFSEADGQRKAFGSNVKFQSPNSYKAMQKTGKFDLKSSSWLGISGDEVKFGYRDDNGVKAGISGEAHLRRDDLGWRASLRVKKV